MEVILFLLLLLSSSFPSVPSSTTTASTKIAGNESDMLSLLAFKSQLTQKSASALSSWNDTNHFCGWIGVSCSNTKHPQRVTTLKLNYLSLAGFISPFLANLTFLTNLSLSNNDFYGMIPPELGIMHHLQLLDLSFNSLHGEISTSLTNCSELVTLELTSNTISGKIPVGIGSLSKLRYLCLSNNSLTGGIPSSVSNLSSLNQIFLPVNQLEGSIPYEIGRLHSLQVLLVSENKLSGTIPSSLFNLSSIFYFALAANQLEGSLPPTMGLTLPNLQKIFFGNNYFQGPFPHSLLNASKLSFIAMGINYLSGTLPPNLGVLSSLYHLNLEENQFEISDHDGWEFLTSLTNCSQLELLYLSSNNVSGELPNSISNLSTHLQNLALGNNIVGQIPFGIGNLVNLTVLKLGPNHLTGVIPESFGKIQRLQYLDLEENGLTGNLPSSLGNLTDLIYLYLDQNNFDGSLAPSLGNLQKLEELYLGENEFSGTIPKEIFSLPSLRMIGLSYNSLVGHIPAEVNKMQNLGELYIPGNKLIDEIPSTLGDCQLLEILDLSQNLLNGSIPSSFSNLKELQHLDLSRNNLSGSIPHFLESLSLTYLNLSFNDFEGEIPVKQIFQNATATSLQGNDGICGGIRDFFLPPCPTKSTKKKGISLQIKVVISIASVLFGLFVSLLLIYWKRKPKRDASTLPSSEDQHLRASYIELAKATEGFSRANLIGTGSYGSVYKGKLAHGNKMVAVKVFNLEEQGASKSFIDEYDALRHIRHRNLIKILTTCSSIDSEGNDFKALVFEFMPNGNLDRWLHAEKSVGLFQRLNIAIDIADAIDYMHHDCQTPVIHRDLKPSNILLDNDMVAHVGDFGIAKALQDSICSVGIRGTIGYVAPEYGSGGKMSTSGDVYSYGILLLEIFTGRRPVDDLFKEGHSLHEFVEMAFPDRVMDIIDPVLLLQNEGAGSNGQAKIRRNSSRGIQECLQSVIGVGLSCSRESPRERMNMRAAAMELHAIRDAFIKEGV